MRRTIERAFGAGSAAAGRLLRLDALYAELDGRLRAFAARAPFRCPPGCGRCSAKFEPDVLPVEAEYAALHARANGVALGEPAPAPAGRCPLYREDDPRHCPIYPARPLVCRLFGFAALPDKTGALLYTPCELMESPAGLERRSYRADELEPPPGSLPPSMPDYAARLSLVAPGEESARRPLGRALREATAKIELYARLKAKGYYPYSDLDRPKTI
jgi:Fe-S-cluster containining protein